MKLNIINGFVIAFCLSNICFSCQSQNFEKALNKVGKVYNTTIVVNFKKQSDRSYTKLSQLNPLYFQPVFVSPPMNNIDTSDKLKTIIKITISEPTYLALGFNVFYIEPSDSFNISYETLLHTKTHFKDTVTINNGNAFFISPKDRSPLLASYIDKILLSLKSIKQAYQMNEYLSTENLTKITDNYVANLCKDFPNLKTNTENLEKLRTNSIDRVYYHLLYELKFIYINTSDKVLKEAILSNIVSMIQQSCMRKERFFNAINWGKYLSIYQFLREVDTDSSSIMDKFVNCNDTVQQYILLNLYKDGLFTSLSNKTEELGFIDKLTYPPFRYLASNVNQNVGVEKLGYITNIIRELEIFDVNNKSYNLDDLFKTTTQPYILFDFCGSWCKPCIEEIAEYAKLKNLSNSKQVRPIWLFFENDKATWLEIVKKYSLKKENCYVIVGNAAQTLTKEFALLFDWQGEFPHHFLFSQHGKIMQKNARSLSVFTEKDISPVKSENNNSINPSPVEPK